MTPGKGGKGGQGMQVGGTVLNAIRNESNEGGTLAAKTCAYAMGMRKGYT